MANFDAVFAIVSLAGILLIFYGPWQELSADFARQVIFEQREKLFDLAADGHLEFTSDAYRNIRSHLEKTIRFSHEMTVFRFILLYSALRGAPTTGESVLGTAVHSISDHTVRRAVQEIVTESSKALMLAMAARSVLLLISVAFALGVRKLGLWAGMSVTLTKFQRVVQKEVEFAPSQY